jgi:hypothetical protein
MAPPRSSHLMQILQTQAQPYSLHCTNLALLTSSSAEHFNRAPEDGTRADVGRLGSYLEGLQEVKQPRFPRGRRRGLIAEGPIALTGFSRRGSAR